MEFSRGVGFQPLQKPRPGWKPVLPAVQGAIMEHDRFFDLVRWGTAQTVLNASGKPNFSNGRDVLLPIPQQQIDLSQGVLTKNPGY